MSKNIKDRFDGLTEEELVKELTASKIQVVDKTTTDGIVEAGVDTVIVNGSVNKIGVYGSGTDDITVKGYAGSGSVKSVAGIELTDKEGRLEGVSVTLEDSITAKLVAGAKVEFTDKKDLPGSVEQLKTVEINGSEVTIFDAKVTDAFAGAVMTDTATSKKYRVDVQAVTYNASIDVIGGTVTNVFAGGAGATSTTNAATVNISGGKVTNVYAGGAEGAKVVGDVAINIDMNAAATASDMNIGTIYAGGKNANVFGDVVITVTTNGAIGTTGKIGKIVGAPQGNGVVYGNRNLVLDAYQGDFAASVKGMDTVTILDNSAVTFSKAQDKSMVNAEYIIELSEIDNSNQAAILTLKSDYKLNKLTVSIDADLISEGGSFSRALIQGVKGKFNSDKFDVNQVNIAKEDGGLIADYQYELAFETVTDAKGRESETGKLIFTYTGAELELSVDGYINRYGVANVLSSADDVVNFGASWDPMAGKNNPIYNDNGIITGMTSAGILEKEITYNFKTMAGDDTVTIDDDVYFTGKLSLGAGDDTLTINGYLAKLDLAGEGENEIIVNGTLDARNITTSDDSDNTFVINSDRALYSFEVRNTVTHDFYRKDTFYYTDGSWTEDEIDSKKKLLYVELNAYNTVTGELLSTTTTPFPGPTVEVDRWLAGLTQTVTTTGAAPQDLVLDKGDNTVIINNGAGVGDITLKGGNATVEIASAYNGAIDMRDAASSTLIIDKNAAFTSFQGSRIGENKVIIAADFTSSVAQLDLKLANTDLEIAQGVTLRITGGWTQAGFAKEDITFGDNAVLTFVDENGNVEGEPIVYNYSGFWQGGMTALGTVSDSVIDGGANALVIENLVSSEVSTTSGSMTFGTVVDSDITTETGTLTFNGVVTSTDPSNDKGTDITFEGNATAVFNDDATITSFDYGANTANISVLNADVTIYEIINKEYVAGEGIRTGNIIVNLDLGTLTVAALENATVTMANDSALNVAGDFAGDITDPNSTITATDSTIIIGGSLEANTISLTNSDLVFGTLTRNGDTDIVRTVNNLTIDAQSAIMGAVLTVEGILSITGDFNFDATTGTNIVLGDEAAIKAQGGTISGEVGEITIENSDDAEAVIENATVGTLTVVSGTIGNGVVAKESIITAATIATIADGAGVDLGAVSGAAALTAEGTATFTADSFANGATLTGDKFVINSEDGIVDVTGGNLELVNTELETNVRVWDYDDTNDEPYGITAKGEVALKGTFEADITAGVADDPDTTTVDESEAATIILRDGTQIISNDPDNAVYGTLEFIGTEGTLVAEGETAEGVKVANGVYAENLQFTGKISADFDVDETLTLGSAATDDDYVTGDKGEESADAEIIGNVEAADIDVEAGVLIQGDVTADNDVDVYGTLDAEGDVTADAEGDVTAENVNVYGTLDAEGDVTAENVNVNGTYDDNNNFVGASLEAANVTADSVYVAAGINTDAEGKEVRVASSLTATNVTAEDVDVDGTLTATNVTAIVTDEDGDIVEGTVDVDGTLTAKDNVTAGFVYVNGTLTAEGDVTAIVTDEDGDIVEGTVQVGGTLEAVNVNAYDVDVDGTMTAKGNVTAENDVDVDGTLTLTAKGNVTAENVNVYGTLNAEGDVTAENVNVYGTYDNNNFVGASLEAANVTADRVYVAAGIKTDNEGNEVPVASSLTATNVTAIVTDEAGSGTVEVYGTLTAKGNVTAGFVDVYGTLDAEGDVTAIVTDEDGDIVEGTVQVGGTLEADNVNAYDVDVYGTLNAEGDVTAENDVDVNGTLTATGDVTAENVNVNGTYDNNNFVGASLKADNVTADRVYVAAGTKTDDENNEVRVASSLTATNVTAEDVEVNGSLVVGGNLIFEADGEENTLMIDEDGELTFSTEKGGVVFSNNLTLTGDLAANITTKEYEVTYTDPNDGEDKTITSYDDVLDITGESTIEGAIDLGKGEDTLVLDSDIKVTGGIKFGEDEGIIAAESDAEITADITAADLTVGDDYLGDSDVTVNGGFTVTGSLVLNTDLTVDNKDGFTIGTIDLGTDNVLTSQYTYTYVDEETGLEEEAYDYADITVSGEALVVEGTGTINAATINGDIEVVNPSGVNINAAVDGNVTANMKFADNITEDEKLSAIANSTMTFEGSVKEINATDLVIYDMKTGEIEAVGTIGTGADGVTAEKVIFSSIKVAEGSIFKADFVADKDSVQETAGDSVITETNYGLIGGNGPAANGCISTTPTDVGCTTVALYLGDNVTINGNITSTDYADQLILNGSAEVEGTIDFGMSASNMKGSVGEDIISGSNESALKAHAIKFGQQLTINNVDIDRNEDLGDISSTIEGQIDESLAGVTDPTQMEAQTYTVTVNGKAYEVKFDIDQADFTKNSASIVNVDCVTIAGTEANNTLTFATETEVDGSINLAAGDDRVVLQGGLTLNELDFGEIDTVYSIDIDDPENIFYEGSYSVDIVAKDSEGNEIKTNVLDLGAGKNELVMADGVTLTAAEVLFEGGSLTIAGTEDTDDTATIDAALKGDTVTINRAGVTINGDVAADVVLNEALTFGDDAVLTGNLTLNQKVTFTTDNPETEGVEADTAIVEGFTQGAVTFAAGVFEINNVANVKAGDNAAAATGDANKITSVSGTVDADGNQTELVIKNTVTTGNTSVDEKTFEVEDVANIAKLTINGNVTIGTATNIDSLVMNAGATLDGTIKFNKMTVSGEGEVDATIKGTTKQDILTLIDANIGAVNFNAYKGGLTDTLILEGENTSTGTILFTGYGRIEEGKVEGSLTGNVVIDGIDELTGELTGKLTIDADITGNVTVGAGSAVDLELGDAGEINGIVSGFADITGSDAADFLTLGSNAAEIDLGGGNDTVKIAHDGAVIEQLTDVETIALDKLFSFNIVAGEVETLDLSAITAEQFVEAKDKDVVFNVAAEFDTVTNGLGIVADGDNFKVSDLEVNGVNYDVTLIWDGTDKKYTVDVTIA